MQVAVRIRPRCKHERKQNSEHETNAVWPEGLSTVHVFAGPGKPPKSMHFDSALGPDSSQEEVFEGLPCFILSAMPSPVSLLWNVHSMNSVH